MSSRCQIAEHTNDKTVFLFSCQRRLCYEQAITDRVRRQDNAIGHVRQSVRLSRLYILDQLIFDLDLLHAYRP